MSALTPETVAVGDGVTYGVGSDSYAGTVVKVSPSGKTIGFTHDGYTAAEGSDYYGDQKYEYTSTEAHEWTDALGETQSNVKTARWNAKRGCFLLYGRALGSGRRTYFNPSF